MQAEDVLRTVVSERSDTSTHLISSQFPHDIVRMIVMWALMVCPPRTVFTLLKTCRLLRKFVIDILGGVPVAPDVHYEPGQSKVTYPQPWWIHPHRNYVVMCDIAKCNNRHYRYVGQLPPTFDNLEDANAHLAALQKEPPNKFSKYPPFVVCDHSGAKVMTCREYVQRYTVTHLPLNTNVTAHMPVGTPTAYLNWIRSGQKFVHALDRFFGDISRGYVGCEPAKLSIAASINMMLVDCRLRKHHYLWEHQMTKRGEFMASCIEYAAGGHTRGEIQLYALQQYVKMCNSYISPSEQRRRAVRDMPANHPLRIFLETAVDFDEDDDRDYNGPITAPRGAVTDYMPVMTDRRQSRMEDVD